MYDCHVPTLQLWLTISDGARAVKFYQDAFSAVETYHLEDPDGNIVSRLQVEDGVFWVSGGSTDGESPVGGETIRMVLISQNPEVIVAKAIGAGATEVFPVGEGHGWKMGRIIDPFGLHWEIGHELSL